MAAGAASDRLIDLRRPGFRWGDGIAVGAAVIATLALVVPSYDRRPFWFDELVSIEIARLPARAFLDYLFSVEANMALYHVLLKPWLAVSDAEAFVRVLSIAFACATLPVLYALAVRLFDRRTAVFAVLLLAVNVSWVGYARDARSYPLAVLLVTVSTYALVAAVETSRRRYWWLYAAAAGLAVWAHLFAGAVVAAQVVWLVLERRVLRVRRALPALVGLVAVLLPIVLAVVVGRQGAQLDWLERPRLRQVPGLFEWFVESRATVAIYFVGGVFALVGAIGQWRRSSGPRTYMLLLLWLLLPVPLAFVASYASPIYLYRYFLVCLPALVLLVAAGFARLRPAWIGLALTAAAIAFSVKTVDSCQPDCKIRHDDWEAAAAHVAAASRPGDAILFYPSEVRTPLAHYLARRRPALLYPERWGLIGGDAEGSRTLDGALRHLDRHERVWLVTWWLPSEPARTALARRARRIESREFEGDVRVELYRPAAS